MEIGSEKKLRFNPDKGAVMILNTERLGQPTSMTTQGQLVEVLDRYKYLGTTMSDGPNYRNKSGRKRQTRQYNSCMPSAYGLSTDSKYLESNGKPQQYPN